jgi:aryl-alcohol dehydrogenase-like predicted oxidoreductase
VKRRDFLASLTGLVAGGMAARPGPSFLGSGTQGLPTRRLGRTGVDVPILGLGGFHVGNAGSETAARQLVEMAFAEGVRFFDNAESYGTGRAERWMGAALESIRSEVVLMSKSFHFPARTAEGTRGHLEGSLERLRTDYLDLWQLHSVRSVEDVDRAFVPGGSMEAMLRAKEEGLVRFIGVTGHARPEANLRAIHYFDQGYRFDTMQMPLNPIDFHQRSFQRQVLPALVERDIGVIAMKTSADGRLVAERICTIEECLRYAWSLPIAVAVVGMEREAEVRANARLARGAMMTETEMAGLRARIAERAELGVEWYKS